MAREIEEKEWIYILEALKLFPTGASPAEVQRVLKIYLPPYSLRRRLATLVRQGLIESVGKTKNIRYRLKTVEDTKTALREEIFFSEESLELQKKIELPLSLKSPVSYHREFLDAYHPNTTKYLSDSICQKLLALGKTESEKPAGTYAKQIFHRLLIDLSWNSSRLEGNTYSLLETEKLLESNELAEGKDLKEARMILNHKDAIEFLVNSAPEIGINRYTILNLHAILSNDLLADLESCGRLRSIAIGITGSKYTPLSVPPLIQEIFEQIINTASLIKNPFEQAFFLMVHLPYLQAFEDVNKRVSRLSANIPLIQKNLCPLSFIDVPEKAYINGLLAIYELNRIEILRDVFVWAYERSCLRYSKARKELGEPDPFKMRYRPLITNLISHIIREKMNKTEAIAFLRKSSSVSVPLEDQSRVIEMIEKELMALHEGNIARHHIRPFEYESWLINWR